MIEIFMFFYWILSSMLFMALSYFFKQRGMWRAKRTKQMRDIWNHKDSDDILSYMRFEYRNFCMSGCFLLYDFTMISWFIYSDGSRSDIMINSISYYKEIKQTYGLIFVFIILLAINRLVYFVFMHRFHSSNGVNYMIGPREPIIMTGINISFFFVGVIIYIYELTRNAFGPFLYIWCFAELLNSLFLIPYYYSISRTIYKDLLVTHK